MRRVAWIRGHTLFVLVMLGTGLGTFVGLPAETPTLRIGGTLESLCPLHPMPQADAALTLIAGSGEVDLSSRTDITVYPYTQSKETLGVSLVRDWLTLAGDWSFSLLPIGITQARIVARATPPHVLWETDGTALDLGFLGEARAKGYSFAELAQRSELWLKGTVMAVSAKAPWVDQAGVGAWLEGIVSAPGPARLGLEATLVANARLRWASLQSETALSLTPLRLDEQRFVVTGAWPEPDLQIRAVMTLGGANLALGFEVGAILRFGEGRASVPSSSCIGGVCTDW